MKGKACGKGKLMADAAKDKRTAIDKRASQMAMLKAMRGKKAA